MSNLIEINIDELLRYQKSNRLIIKGIENHFDELSSHVILMHGHMTSLLGPLMISATTGKKLNKEVILSKIVEVLKHTVTLCGIFEYELPDVEELLDYDEGVPFIVKHDSILTLTNMMMATLDILHVVYVDCDSVPIWSDEHPPEDIQDNIKCVLLGIKDLGKKHGFTMTDVMSYID